MRSQHPPCGEDWPCVKNVAMHKETQTRRGIRLPLGALRYINQFSSVWRKELGPGTMRIDARNLLDRLGRSDFNYKEFEDRFTDLELWPILEALLRDPRLQALDQGEQASPVAAVRGPEQAERAAESAKEPIQVLFSRYEHAPEAATPPPTPRPADPSGDVRALLRRLSAAVETDGNAGGSLTPEGSA